MNYTIISINENRKKNIQKIISVLQKEPQKTRSYNGKKEQDLIIFKSLHPEIDIEKYAIEPKVPINPSRREGEIGCWLSHYHIWKHVVKENLESILVFEDDCFVNENLIKKIPIVVDKIDLILLGNWTECVYINNKAAKMLLGLSQEYIKYGPVDEFLMAMIRLTGMRLNGWPIPICGKLPLTRQLIEEYESDIQPKN